MTTLAHAIRPPTPTAHHLRPSARRSPPTLLHCRHTGWRRLLQPDRPGSEARLERTNRIESMSTS